MAEKACDFCAAPVTWTENEVEFDRQLRLAGSGLGVLCQPCSDKQVAVYERMEREDREREELEDKIDAHFAHFRSY